MKDMNEEVKPEPKGTTGDAALGWGIPMATDIAFAIGALTLLASRVPKTLITFLVALAIVDDLGAVMVIAVFYTNTIALGPLVIAGGLFALLLVFNQSGIRKSLPYFIPGGNCVGEIMKLRSLTGSVAHSHTRRSPPDLRSNHYVLLCV